jgi:hypothetical protein
VEEPDRLRFDLVLALIDPVGVVEEDEAAVVAVEAAVPGKHSFSSVPRVLFKSVILLDTNNRMQRFKFSCKYNIQQELCARYLIN